VVFTYVDDAESLLGRLVRRLRGVRPAVQEP